MVLILYDFVSSTHLVQNKDKQSKRQVMVNNHTNGKDKTMHFKGILMWKLSFIDIIIMNQ